MILANGFNFHGRWSKLYEIYPEVNVDVFKYTGFVMKEDAVDNFRKGQGL